MLARVYAISGDASAVDPDYLIGLRRTVQAALEYGLAAMEIGEESPLAIPLTLLVQARAATHSGVGLDTMLRRYLAGYSLLSEFVIEEAERGDLLARAGLQRVLRDLSSSLDRAISAVTAERNHEQQRFASSKERRRRERVERILAGELLDTHDLGYPLDASHLGVIAAGPGADEALRRLAVGLNRRLLLVRRDSDVIWGWLGAGRALASATVLEHTAGRWAGPLAVGEPGKGIAGWRLTHAQAKAAFTVARLRGEGSVRYADVALLAATLRDDLLVSSLRELYLDPLSHGPDGGAALRETLRAWFTAERNLSSAAAALGVNRRTVANRLRIVDQRLGRPLVREAALHMETALRLEELEEGVNAPTAKTSVSHYA